MLEDSYGGYDLGVGDRDPAPDRPAPVYGGKERTAANNDNLPASSVDGFVKQLQKDLKTLGFAIAGTADGDFGWLTDAAVREFQIHARCASVAKATGADPRTYTKEPNDKVYDGRITGAADAKTRQLLTHWIDSKYRCPVIIEGWEMRAVFRRNKLFKSGADKAKYPNLWRHDDMRVGDVRKKTDKTLRVRVFVRDFSGTYAGASHDPKELIQLGKYYPYEGWGGPAMTPAWESDPEAEITPESLAGRSLNDPSLGGHAAAFKSTFSVIRAVSEAEVGGFLDPTNSYDRAILSAGPYHHTIALTGDRATGYKVSEGELAGAFRASADASGVRRDL